MVNAASDTPYSGRFIDGEHRFAVRVYFEDTDLTGVVYHANYLRFMERARSDIMRIADLDQRASHAAGEGSYAVAEVAIRYRAPARLDDDLLVRSQMTSLRAAACRVQQRVMRGDQLLAEASVLVAFVGPDGRPRRQPSGWIETFKRIRGAE